MDASCSPGSHEIRLCAFEFSLGLDTPEFELGHSGRFFENAAAFDRAGLDQLGYAALLDDAVRGGSDACVDEEVLDVLEPNLLIVDQIFTTSVSVEPTATSTSSASIEKPLLPFSSTGFSNVNVTVAAPSGFLAEEPAKMTSIMAAPTKGLRRSFTEYPFDGIDDIRFAAAIGPDDAYFLLLEPKVHRICE